MRVWQFACVLIALLALFVADAGAQGPNVIVVVADDIRYDGLAATGHPFVETPNIDRLATEGITFENAFVTIPLCSPSRASFYSGQHARSHGIRGNSQGNSVSDRTLSTWARTLQQAGYNTGHVGKWHMDPTAAPRFGFEYWASFRDQGAHTDSLLNVNGVETSTIGFTTDVLTDYAISFIESNHSGRPFALSLAYKAVHGPFPADDSNVPLAYRTLYENEPIERAVTATSDYTLAGKLWLLNPPQGLEPLVPGVHGPTDHLIRNQMRMTAHIDENIGRILAALEQAGILDDTLIIFSSDNGYFWGEHGMGGKRVAYEESIRVPILMRHPGLIAAGVSNSGLVALTDIGPTLMELAGATIPSHVEGISLAPLLSEPAGAVRSDLLLEYFAEPSVPRISDWKALRTDTLKYITFPTLGTAYDELYDLSVDPFEMTNRIDDPSFALAREDMKRLLARREYELEPEAVEIVIPADLQDYEIAEALTIRHGSVELVAGARAAGPTGGRNGVVMFEVPVLPPGHVIESASVKVQPASNPDRSVDSSIHVDVWALGIGPATPILAYLESDTDATPGLVKIDEDVLWSDHVYGSVELDPDAALSLAHYITDFHTANPSYAGGAYLSLRFNPDGDTGDTQNGWDIISAEHSLADLRPELKLKMTSLDSDGDGLSDVKELQIGTDPIDTDSDNDGLLDGVENNGGVFVDPTLTGSNPLLADSDGDGITDGDEVTAGTDPNVFTVTSVPMLENWGLGILVLLLATARNNKPPIGAGVPPSRPT